MGESAAAETDISFIIFCYKESPPIYEQLSFKQHFVLFFSFFNFEQKNV